MRIIFTGRAEVKGFKAGVAAQGWQAYTVRYRAKLDHFKLLLGLGNGAAGFASFDAVCVRDLTSTRYEYIYGLGTRLAKLEYEGSADAAQVYYYHQDLLGSPVMVTDVDGQVTWRGDYGAFGEALDIQTSWGNPYTYLGNEDDGSLRDFGARFYDARVGRFISPDPIKNVATAGAVNPYTYCANNPLKYTDRFGLMAERAKPEASPEDGKRGGGGGGMDSGRRPNDPEDMWGDIGGEGWAFSRRGNAWDSKQASRVRQAANSGMASAAKGDPLLLNSARPEETMGYDGCDWNECADTIITEAAEAGNGDQFHKAIVGEGETIYDALEPYEGQTVDILDVGFHGDLEYENCFVINGYRVQKSALLNALVDLNIDVGEIVIRGCNQHLSDWKAAGARLGLDTEFSLGREGPFVDPSPVYRWNPLGIGAGAAMYHMYWYLGFFQQWSSQH